MKLQIIQDDKGKNTGIFIPINDWNTLTEKYADLKNLVSLEPLTEIKLSSLAGKLSHETAEEILNYVAESRNEWDGRLNNQF